MNGSAKTITAITTIALSAACTQAAVVWSEDFSDDTVGSPPKQNVVIATGNDWTTNSGVDFWQTVANLGTDEAPNLAYSAFDDSGTNSASGYVNFTRMNPFDTTDPATAGLNVTFDMRVDSFTGSGASTFRFVVADGGARYMVIGFGFANLDADPAAELTFYAVAGTSTGPTPSAANAIGGFDLGEYDSTTPAANDTNDSFYRVSLNFVDGSPTVTGTIAPVDAPEQAQAFSRSLAADGFSFSSASGAGDYFSIILPQGGRGQLYVDNIVVSVPEPASLAGVALGAMALLRRRR